MRPRRVLAGYSRTAVVDRKHAARPHFHAAFNHAHPPRGTGHQAGHLRFRDGHPGVLRQLADPAPLPRPPTGPPA